MEENHRFINSVNLKAGTDFPYLVLEIINEQSFPMNPGFQVMHWHEDVQFIYVLEGQILVKTLYGNTVIEAGESVFINKSVVHRIAHTGSCHYYSFVFPDYFLKFYFGSPAAGLVERIVGREQIPVFAFTADLPWCGPVFAILRELIELEKDKTDFYVYEVLTRLSALWLAVSKNIILPPARTNGALGLRMQTFLNYIEAHYAEDISLDCLAESAHVSKSECLRCFKVSMQTTPLRYLMEYRLQKAAELLAATDEPIGTVAMNVGFRQSSHFGKCFREKTGCSPKEYRKRQKEAHEV